MGFMLGSGVASDGTRVGLEVGIVEGEAEGPEEGSGVVVGGKVKPSQKEGFGS